MKKLIKWRNYLIFYLLILLLFNFLLLKFPLTNVFGYEFSLFNSLLLVMLTAIYAIYFFRNFFEKYKLEFTGELFKSAFLLFIIPFCVSVINSFLNGFCSFCDGLWFYLVITGPSIIVGIALGLFSVLFRDRLQLLVLFFLFVGILSIIALEIYFNPQVYVFNPIIGYFPGTVYDNTIEISSKLIIYRIINVIFFGLIISYSLKIKRKRSKRSLVNLFVIVSCVLFYFFSPDLGFSTTINSLSSQLSNSVVSDHFVIHYDKRIESKDIKMLALHQEYYYQELKEFFQAELPERTHSFVFFDDNQKKDLFGSKNADVSKPWLNQIYVSYNSWESTLKHELAHCFSATFGAGILKLAAGLNPFLIEGIAEAADGNYDDNSLSYLAYLAYNSGFEVNLEDFLTKYGFFSKSSTMSYICAGSFIQYLIDKYGINRFKHYYVTAEFQNTYGITLNSAINDYNSYLAGNNFSYSHSAANYYFAGKSLFQKICPRAISSMLEEGWEQFNNMDYSGAEESFRNILKKAQNFSALVGLANSLEKKDSVHDAVKVLKANIDSFSNTPYYYNLELILADLLVEIDEFNEARAYYDSLSEQRPNRHFNYISNTRKELLKNNLLKQYINGSNYDKLYYLQVLNNKSYRYSTIPVIIDLSKFLDEDYQIFKKNFEKNFSVQDYESSYAAFKLSEYMLENFDFVNARKLSSLSLRFSGDKSFKTVLEAHYSKTKWFLQYVDEILKSIKLNIN